MGCPAAPPAGFVLGEDVVELVAAAAQAPDVGALAVVVLERRLVGGVVLVLVVVLLGEAEVHERTVPGVAKGHQGSLFAETAIFPAYRSRPAPGAR